MKTIPTIILLIALLALPALAQTRRDKSRSSSNPTFDQVEGAVRKGFGPKVKIETRLSLDPYRLLGDFNGDGFSDIAVLVNIEDARADLTRYGVKYTNIDPYSPRNGSQIDPLTHDWHNCLGIAMIHGTIAGWTAANPAGRFMVYQCFSAFRLVRKGERIRRGSGSTGPTPRPKGDSILLDLETGGTQLVYWNGKTYRGFGIRGGD